MPWAFPKTGKIFPHGIDFEEDEKDVNLRPRYYEVFLVRDSFC